MAKEHETPLHDNPNYVVTFEHNLYMMTMHDFVIVKLINYMIFVIHN